MKKILNPLYSLQGYPKGNITQISWSSDGKLIAAGFDGTDNVWIWDTEKKEHFYTLPLEGQTATSLLWLPNTLFLIVGCIDGSIGVWDVKKEKIDGNKKAKVHSKAVHTLILTKESELISLGLDGKVCCTVLSTDKLQPSGWGSGIFTASYIPDKRGLIFARGKNVWYCLMNGASEEKKGVQSANASYISCSSDGKEAAVGSDDGSIRLWNLDKERDYRIVDQHKAKIVYIQYFKNSQIFLSKSADGLVNIIDSATLETIVTYNSESKAEYSIGLAIHPINSDIIAILKTPTVMEITEIVMSPTQNSNNKITELRSKLSKEQLIIVEEIWKYFVENYDNRDIEKRFISKKALYGRVRSHGIVGEPFNNAINDFTGSVLFQNSEKQNNDPVYGLQYLGPFLTSDGDRIKKLLIICLEYLRKECETRNVIKTNLEQMILNEGLNDEDRNLLKVFFQTHGLHNLIKMNNETLSFEGDIVELLESKDLEALLEKYLHVYDPNMPIESLGQLGYARKNMSNLVNISEEVLRNETEQSTPKKMVSVSILNNYKHVGSIGEGYFCTVKTYRHKKTKQLCAVKELRAELLGNKDYIRWFINEVRMLRDLRKHENVVELIDYEIDTTSNKYLYIMPKADENLHNYIKCNNQKLTLEERLKIFEQILRAIKFAHSKKRLHRDIAPQNVLVMKTVDASPIIKVCDFGIGKNLSLNTAQTHSNMANFGHPYYMAPEQAKKLKDATFASDIYSLGKLFNFILTGKDPDKIYKCEFQELIEKATDSEIERYKTIGDFEEEYIKQKDSIRSVKFAQNKNSQSLNTEEIAEKILIGVRKVHINIAKSFGPNGSGMRVQIGEGEPVLHKSGVNIAQAIMSEDSMEKMGIKQMQMAAKEVYKQIGDATKLTLLLTCAIVENGYEQIKKGFLKKDVIIGIQKALSATINYFNSQKISVNFDLLLKVATTAARNDELAKLVVETLDKIGKHGEIVVEEVDKEKDKLVIVEGMKLDNGYATEEFVEGIKERQLILIDCYVLSYPDKILSTKEILPLLEQVARQNKSLLIVAHEVEGGALSTLILNNSKKLLKVVAVNMQYKQFHFKDIAVYTGGKVLSQHIPISLENYKLEDLGKAKEVIVSRNSTIIKQGEGSKELIQSHVLSIKTDIENARNSFEKKVLRQRLANLVGATAIINVTARTEIDKIQEKYEINSALFSAKSSIETGCICGGGVSFLSAKKSISGLVGANDGENAGIEAFSRSLEEPIKCLMQSAKIDVNLLATLLNIEEHNTGFNVNTMKRENLLESGVIDSLLALTTALEVACSYAKALLQENSF